MLSDTAAKFEGNKAFMKSGKTVEFDVLVLAVGVKAQVSLVKNAGGEVGRGIIVDTHMRTSLENVYSAVTVRKATTLLSELKEFSPFCRTPTCRETVQEKIWQAKTRCLTTPFL